MSRFDWIPVHPEGKEWVMWDDDRQTFLGSVCVYSSGIYHCGSNVMGDTDQHISMRDAAATCQDHVFVRKGMLL